MRMQFRFDGKRLSWVGPSGEMVTFDVTRLPAELAETAKIHGLKQKIADAGAIERNPETGKPATVGEKFAAMQKVVDNLYDGNWSMRALTPSDDNLLILAIVEVSGKPYEKVRDYVKGLSKSQKTAMADLPKYKTVIERMRADTAAGVDVETLDAGIESL